MDLFSSSRCVLMLVGFESLHKGSLSQVATKFARLSDEEREAKYRQLVAELSARGIATWGCFIFGFEDDAKETFMRTLKFALESGVMVYQATVITPQPGTPLFSRALGDLAYPLKPGNWGRYDFMQPVTRHLSRHLSNAEVMRLMHFTIRVFYRKRNILAMVWRSRIPKSFLRLASKAAIRGAFMRLF